MDQLVRVSLLSDHSLSSLRFLIEFTTELKIADSHILIVW